MGIVYKIISGHAYSPTGELRDPASLACARSGLATGPHPRLTTFSHYVTVYATLPHSLPQRQRFCGLLRVLLNVYGHCASVRSVSSQCPTSIQKCVRCAMPTLPFLLFENRGVQCMKRATFCG